VDTRLGSMCIAATLCHVASSNIHAPQVTRALVRVEYDLQQLSFLMIFRTHDVSRNITGGVHITIKTTGYQYVLRMLQCLHRSPFPHLIFKAQA
jgi:hypothetical protein